MLVFFLIFLRAVLALGRALGTLLHLEGLLVDVGRGAASAAHRSAGAAAATPPSVLRRSLRSTCAVAQRRLGPISSATTSTTLRFSPSRVSYSRCSRRPFTMTRAPLVSDDADVLAQLAPGGDVDEGGLLLPLAVLLVAAVDGEAEGGDGLAALREAQLGVAREVADQGDVCCPWIAPFVSEAAAQPAATPRSRRPRRAASASGRRMTLWRTTSSARRSERSRSSSAPGSATMFDARRSSPRACA